MLLLRCAISALRRFVSNSVSFYFIEPQCPAIDNETVCIFGASLTQSEKCTLITFNTASEEKIIAQTSFRTYCGMAVVNGKQLAILVLIKHSRFFGHLWINLQHVPIDNNPIRL